MTGAVTSPARSRISVWLQRALALATLSVAVYLFLPLLRELRAAGNLILQASWLWLPAALGVQLTSYGFLTWLNLLALRPFPGRIGFGRMAATLTSMAFIEVAIPSAGASGVVLRARLLGKHGYSLEASTFSLAVENAFIGLAMGSLSLAGLIHLLQRGELNSGQVARLALLGAATVVAVVALWHVIADQDRSRQALGLLVRGWNGIAGRWRRVDPAGLEPRLADFRANLEQLRRVPLWMFLLAAAGRAALDVATLGICFLLYGHAIPPGTLLTGYGLILLMSGLASLPGGLGVADVSVPIIFARLGEPGAVALAAGLTYRLIAWWLLRFVGFVSWQVMEART